MAAGGRRHRLQPDPCTIAWMDNALDVLLVATAGEVDSATMRTIASNVEHLAQMIDDESEAAECYRAAAALRGFAIKLQD